MKMESIFGTIQMELNNTNVARKATAPVNSDN